MPFKWNNPGCPCCDCPCACYKFDGDAEDSASSLDLTSTDDASYSTGYLDEASKHTGTQFHEHNDNACFNLSGGINVWFWAKSDYEAPYSWGVGTLQPEGIVTKGSWENLGSDQRDFDGEWGIFWDETTPNTKLNGNIWFAVGNGAGGLFDADVVAQAPYEKEWEFYFFWASIKDKKIYSMKWSEYDDTIAAVPSLNEQEADLTGTQTLTSDEKLFIGNNKETGGDELAKLGEQTYGSEPRPWLIDNVGFCKDIGTQAEMEERAENLWNDGYGRACNHAGFGRGGCCA